MKNLILYGFIFSITCSAFAVENINQEDVISDLNAAKNYFSYGLETVADKPEKKLTKTRELETEEKTVEEGFADLEKKYFQKESDAVKTGLSGNQKTKKLNRAR